MNPTVIFGNPTNPNFESKHSRLIEYFNTRNDRLHIDRPDPLKRTESMIPTYGGTYNNTKLLFSKLMYKAYKKLKIIIDYHKKIN
jgi:hypothetical protein